MLKALKVTFASLFVLFAGNCLASQSVSATILLSVYVAPADSTTSQQVANAQTSGCNQLLNTTSQPQQTSCQDDNTLYTWQQGGQDLTLTIAPI